MKTRQPKINLFSKTIPKSAKFVGLFFARLISLYAQATPESMPQRGLVPAGSYAISDLETINAVNGNVSYRIPLATLPPGRAGWNMGLNLTYNSQIYDLYVVLASSQVTGGKETFEYLRPSQWSNTGGGWQYGYNYGLDLEIRPRVSGSTICYGSPTPTPDNWKINKLSVISPDGSHHTLHLYPNTPSNPSGYTYSDYDGDGYYDVDPAGNPSGCPFTKPTAAGDLTYYTSDGSYLKVVVSQSSSPYWTNRQWTIYFPDGRTATGFGAQMTAISDRNGNTISVVNTASQTSPYPVIRTNLTDDLNRSITIQYNPDSTTSTQDTITQTGYPEGGTTQTLTWTVNWSTVLISGSSALQYVCSDQGDYCTPGVNSPALQQRVVSSITLPTSQTYSFGYNTNASPSLPGWGELTAVTFPSGAKVNYNYSGENQPKAALGRTTENPVSKKTLTWTDEDDPSMPTRTETSQYSFGDTSSQITNPDGGMVQNSFNDPHISSDPKAGLVFEVIQPDGSTTERIWQQNRPYGSQGIDAANPYLKTEFKSVASGGSPVQASVKTFAIDKNGNQTQLSDYGSSTSSQYGWIPYYSSITHDNQGRPTGYSGGSVLRTTNNSYNVYTSPAGDGTESIADETTAYWHPGSPTVRALLTQSSTTGTTTGSGPGSTSVFSYGDASSHLNLNQEQHWDSQNNSWVSTSYEYDQYGNITKITNPRGIKTSLTYDANNCLTSKVDGAPPAITRSFSFGCDSSTSTGLVTSRTVLPFSPPDVPITSTFSYDKTGRLIKVQETGGTLTRYKKTTYSDQNRQVTAQSDLRTSNDLAIQEVTAYDQLGRVRLTTDPAGSKVETRYYIPGTLNSTLVPYSFQLTSNPYATYDDATMGWTRTTRDQNWRVVEVKYFSGKTLPYPWLTMNDNQSSIGTASTSYSSNTTTTTDVAGVVRTNYADGLGRLIQVTENGINVSKGVIASKSYYYDSLYNLTGVTPAAGSGRTFTYSSLKRLTSAYNPETGTVSYTYDPNGNVLTRTRSGKTTTYQYDNIDQLTSKSYSDSTPAVTYQYSSADRLSTMWNTYGDNSFLLFYAYDGLGRRSPSALGISHVPPYSPPGGTWWLGWGPTNYNLADQVTSVQLPSGRTVNTTYDNAGRVNKVSGVVGIPGTIITYTTTTYFSSPTYSPHGGLQQATLGNGLIEQACFNARLQPVVLRQRTGIAVDCSATHAAPDGSDALHLSYVYASNTSSANTGNILTQTITAQTIAYGTKVFTQNYTYDGVNRLATAAETGPGAGWSQTYGYDVVGNRWLAYNSPGGVPQDPFTPTANTLFDGSNHMIGSGALYDGAGNQTDIGGYHYTYDAENRMRSSSINGYTTTYEYDGNDRRIAKLANGDWTYYIYDAMGSLVEEYTTSSQRMACTTCYLMTDHLGSTRMLTDAERNVISLHDYLPSGEEIPSGTDGRGTTLWGQVDPTQKFTGQERDAETTLDYFGARYMSSPQGRFTSPDRPFRDWDITDPQSWNLYSYVRNNPLTYTDPTGEACVVDKDTGKEHDDNSGGQSCKDAHKEDENVRASATAHGGPSAAVQEVGDALRAFAGNGPKNIEYTRNDPFTIEFQKSAAMNAIIAGIKRDCRATRGEVPVGTGEAFVNTLIDLGIGMGLVTPEAQIGAFNSSYTREGGRVDITVTNPISLNSLLLHTLDLVGVKNKVEGSFGTVHQTLHIAIADPCK